MRALRGRQLLFWLYLLVLVALLRGFFFYQNLVRPFPLEQADTLLLEPGRSIRYVANTLEANSLIPNADELKLWARLTGQARQLQAGEYALEPGMSALDLLDRMRRGEVIYHRVALVEGWTVAQALRTIQAHPRVQVTLPGDYEALQSALGLSVHPEGQFFPDTYLFTAGDSDRDILLRAHRRLQMVLDEAWQTRDAGLPYDSAYEALIMASIVEKETGLASERADIAGVFVRRLQQNMRLQTDPTVIYGMGENFTGNLTRDDLRRPTPYNTYTHHGLPPTPIALAGKAAIMASVQPAEGETLYFVARGDGSHQFSRTLEEHNAAVREYQIENRATNYRSRPATGQESE